MAKQGEAVAFVSSAPRIKMVLLRESLQFGTASLDRLTAEEYAKPEPYAGARPVLKGLTLEFDKWGIIVRYEDKAGAPHTVLLPMAQVRQVDIAE